MHCTYTTLHHQPLARLEQQTSMSVSVLTLTSNSSHCFGKTISVAYRCCPTLKSGSMPLPSPERWSSTLVTSCSVCLTIVSARLCIRYTTVQKSRDTLCRSSLDSMAMQCVRWYQRALERGIRPNIGRSLAASGGGSALR